MFKRLRNAFYIGVILILLAALVRSRGINANPEDDASAIQEMTTVDQGDIVLTVSASGPLQPQDQVPLAFASTGNVTAVNVAPGNHVLKGQTLATLDTRLMQNMLQNAQVTLALQQVAFNALTANPREVDVTAAKVALDAARAQYSAATVGYDPLQIRIAELQLEVAKNAAWQSQLQRDQAVQRANASPPEVVTQLYSQIWRLPEPQRDQALQVLGLLTGPSALTGDLLPSPKDAEAQVHKTGYDVQIAEAQLQQTQSKKSDAAAIGNAQLAITSAQTALDRLAAGADPTQIAIVAAQLKAAQAALDLADYNLSQSSLIAPFDGVVAIVNVTANEPAPLDKPALILLDDRSFYLDIPVDEADIAKVTVGQATALAFDALPGEIINGHVTQIAPAADTVAAVVTYAVRIAIDDADRASHALRAGLSATATITIRQLNHVLRVRNRFVRLDRKTGRAAVIVRQPDGKLREVPVTLGLRNETYSEIKGGLALGDVLVVLPRELKLF